MPVDAKQGRSRLPARTISGFPEFLPEVREVEVKWIDCIRSIFESYGFASVETRAVEEVESLAKQGEDVDKEIYQIRRLRSSSADEHDPRFGLHYDLTVPFARFVSQHAADLSFPFKRYQIQKSYRGERPQEGRFREFTQCDFDVVDRDSVSLFFDAELPRILVSVLNALHVGPVDLQINNRKIFHGFFAAMDVSNPTEAIRSLDKLDKIGSEAVRERLRERCELTEVQARACLELASIRTTDLSFLDRARSLGISNRLLDEGLDELSYVMSSQLAANNEECSVIADLSIARGLDYYTGTVYEGRFRNFPEYPSICGGGRYDNLTSAFSRENFPGVGISIGLTRIFTKLLREGLLPTGRGCPTDVLVTWSPGESGSEAHTSIANKLRQRGIRVESYHEQSRLDKQLRYANRKGIRFAVLVSPAGGYEIKDLSSGIQIPFDPNAWTLS